MRFQKVKNIQIIYVLKSLSLKVLIFKSLILCFSLVILSFFPSIKVSFAKSKRTVGDLLKNVSEKKRERISFKKRGHLSSKRRKAIRKGFEKVEPSKEVKVYYKEGYKAELEKLTNKSIKQLYDLSLRYKRSRGRGEIWLRLAKAYTEKSKLVGLRLQEIYNKKLNEYIKKKRRRKPVLKLKEVYAYSEKAIKLYKWFLRDYSKSKRRDEALFFLGTNLFKIGRKVNGEKHYVRLIREFPRSPYVEEVYFALGEYYFELNQWKDALRSYIQAARFKSHRAYFFVLYKISWCYYKLARYKKALSHLDHIIRLGKKKSRRSRDEDSRSHYIYLTNEALSSSVLFYAEGGDYRHAREYFNKHMDLDTVQSSMEKLAQHYKSSNRIQASHFTFLNMIEDDPLSKKAFDHQYQIVSLYLSQGKNENVERELRKWIKKFGPRSAWHKAHEKDRAFIKTSFKNMEMEYRFFILNNHREFQRSKNPRKIELIRESYENYFSLFKGSPKKDEMHFFYAELLFEMKRYDEAVVHYEWIAQNMKQSSYYNKAFLNLILASEKPLPSFKDLEGKRSKDFKKTSFDFRTKRFYRLSNEYLKAFPKNPSRTKIKYKLALLKFYHNFFVEAENQFLEIIEREPRSKYADYSSHLILDIYDLKKDYEGLGKATDKIISLTLLSSPKLVKKMKEIKKRNAFRILESFEKEGKDSLFVARQYEEFLEKNKSGELSILASFNSAIFYEKEKRFIKAIQLYSRVIDSKEKKDKKIYKSALKSRAILYEKIGQYYRAANDFAVYAKAFKTDPLSHELRYNAAKIYDGLRFYDKALVYYHKYYKGVHNKNRFEALYSIGLIWEERSQYKKALIYYDRLMKKKGFKGFRKVELMFRVAKVSQKVGKRKRVSFWYKKAISYFRSLKDKGEKKRALRYASEADFNLVYETYKRYLNIKIKGKEKAQAVALRKKISLIEKLKKDLKRVISYGDSYQIVSALTLQGHASNHMFEFISKAPLPQGLKPEELKVYKKGVEDIALPFRKESQESYKLAFEKALEFRVYGKWRNEAIHAHQKRNPSFADRGKLEEFIRNPLEHLDYFKKYRNKELMSRKTQVLLIKGIQEAFFEKDEKSHHLPSHFLDEFSKWLDKSPHDIFTLNLLAIFHLLRNEMGMAKIIFERALREKKEEHRLYNNLAVLFLKKGKIREAIALLKE